MFSVVVIQGISRRLRRIEWMQVGVLTLHSVRLDLDGREEAGRGGVRSSRCGLPTGVWGETRFPALKGRSNRRSPLCGFGTQATRWRGQLQCEGFAMRAFLGAHSRQECPLHLLGGASTRWRSSSIRTFPRSLRGMAST